MSSQSFGNNPFVTLFPSVEEAVLFQTNTRPTAFNDGNSPGSVGHEPLPQALCGSESMDIVATDSPEDVNISDEELETSYCLEEIFRITLNAEPCNDSQRPTRCVYLDDLAKVYTEKRLLTAECLEQALFERLMVQGPHQCIVVTRGEMKDSIAEAEAGESRVFFYLYQSLSRLQSMKSKMQQSLYQDCHYIIISQVAMCLCHPEIHIASDLPHQLIELLGEYRYETNHDFILRDFLRSTADHVINKNTSGEEDVLLSIALSEPLRILKDKFLQMSLVNSKLFLWFDVLHLFAASPALSNALLDYNIPQELNSKDYQDSLFGAALSISCLPKNENAQFEYFDEPSRYSSEEHEITERNLWIPLRALATHAFQLFYDILKQSPDTRHKLLSWIGSCLHANAGRSKLWNSHLASLLGSTPRSDGFMLNLSAVLLRLCKPFSEPNSPKLLKINPTYCACIVSTEEEVKTRNIHLKDLYKETFLVSHVEDDYSPPRCSYNFSTECFFATHQALHLGFRVVHERLAKLSQDLGHIQRVYEDARIQGGESAEPVQRLKENMERGMTKFLSLKAALLEPETVEQMLNFHVATATWLCNVATNENPETFQPVSFPLPKVKSDRLACIPEFIVENMIDCVIFVRRFGAKTCEVSDVMLDHLMTLILVFMGKPEYMKNPHLRAHLAEMLEAMMPPTEGESNNFLASVYREKVFKEHPLVINLVPILLHVFVSIEMTGQSVQFEQKFQYRRPMYVVLHFLWTIDMHREKMKLMAEEAELNIDAPDPPLFLRFINLLMNDAIFLLDEALSLMSKLRESQQQKEAGAWSNLPATQRQQNEVNFQHMGILARFHNVMSNETIRTLQWLTTEITSIFCHPTLVDRITSMLNYFLLHLVGPKKKNLKVKDLNEYEFKPQQLVENICRIYINLGRRDLPTTKTFCLAVLKDGRSYSAELFPQAQAVLLKIGQAVLASEMDLLTASMQRFAEELQREEEIISDAPEEFLDPIMSTLMTDPVILPASGITIDRTTISRHLLSDQTDPFNRSPLTMDMVQPNLELRQRIEDWRRQLPSKRC